MNQILYNKIKDNSKKVNNLKKQQLKIQFFGSVSLLFVIVIFYFINAQIRNSKESTSMQIANNYNILKLYNNESKSSDSVYTQDGQTFTVIGMIEIPKINIYYPIISEANEKLLKIAPCRIAGPMPNENGNICIAGHNYDNYKFFSRIIDLKIDDEIILYNNDGTKVLYRIFKIYEVLANDLSPLENTDKTKKQVTLITCNNFNSTTRIVIKANHYKS